MIDKGKQTEEITVVDFINRFIPTGTPIRLYQKIDDDLVFLWQGLDWHITETLPQPLTVEKYKHFNVVSLIPTDEVAGLSLLVSTANQLRKNS